MDGLSPKQQKFAEHYATYGNPKEAAIYAGYAESSAHVTGSRLLTNERIIAYVKRKQHEAGERHGVTRDWVIESIAKLAGYDLKDFVTIEELKDEVRARINPDFDGTVATGLHMTPSGPKLTMPDRLAALDKLARILGLYNDKMDVNMQVRTFEQQLDEIDD